MLFVGIVKCVNNAVKMTGSINFQSIQQQHREIGGLLSLALHMKEDMSDIVVEYPVCSLLHLDQLSTVDVCFIYTQNDIPVASVIQNIRSLLYRHIDEAH